MTTVPVGRRCTRDHRQPRRALRDRSSSRSQRFYEEVLGFFLRTVAAASRRRLQHLARRRTPGRAHRGLPRPRRVHPQAALLRPARQPSRPRAADARTRAHPPLLQHDRPRRRVVAGACLRGPGALGEQRRRGGHGPRPGRATAQAHPARRPLNRRVTGDRPAAGNHCRRAGPTAGGRRHHRDLLFEGAEWSWRQVVAEAERRGELLSDLRTDGPFHVGVLLENTPEYLFLLAGAALVGAVIVGINPTRRGAEFASDVAQTDCHCWSPTHPHRALADSTWDRPQPGADRATAPTIELPATGWSRPARGAGGSTDAGRSLPAHLHLGFDRRTQGGPDDPGPGGPGRRRHGVHQEDVLYSAMPLFHGNALSAAVLPALASGATLALRRRFSASGFLPDSELPGPPSSTAWAGPSPTSWPPLPPSTTGTTGSASCSDRRPRPRTRRSSPSGSASRSSKATDRVRAPSCSSRSPTPRPGTLGRAPTRTMWRLSTR